jgi:hypothetical protein
MCLRAQKMRRLVRQTPQTAELGAAMPLPRLMGAAAPVSRLEEVPERQGAVATTAHLRGQGQTQKDAVSPTLAQVDAGSISRQFTHPKRRH